MVSSAGEAAVSGVSLIDTVFQLLISVFLRAAGDVRFAMVTSVVSMFVFRLGAAYLFSMNLNMGALGIWFAMLCDWAVRTVVFSLRWFCGGWKGKSVIAATA